MSGSLGGLIDYSVTLTTTPVQVVPSILPKGGRQSIILFAPGAPNATGGSGDIVFSFTLGSALAQGAAGSLLLGGGEKIVFGGQSGVYAPGNEIWAAAVRETAPLTLLVQQVGV